MAREGDDILVAFLDRQPEGFEFERHRKDWPLHVTLVSWFAAGDQEGLDVALARLAKDQQRFVVRLGEEELFGPSSDVPVNVVSDQVALAGLHQRLSEVVAASAVRMPDTTWAGDAYRAHVTQHGGPDDRNTGDEFTVDSFYRVHLLLGNICRVEKQFLLGDVHETAA